MIIYPLTNDLTKHIADGHVKVDSYTVNATKNTVTVVLHDTVYDKNIKVVFNKPDVKNESFDIVGNKVVTLIIYRHEKVFKSQYFVGMCLEVVNDKNNKVTIVSQEDV